MRFNLRTFNSLKWEPSKADQATTCSEAQQVMTSMPLVHASNKFLYEQNNNTYVKDSSQTHCS